MNELLFRLQLGASSLASRPNGLARALGVWLLFAFCLFGQVPSSDRPVPIVLVPA